jgi:hypothetical protein
MFAPDALPHICRCPECRGTFQVFPVEIAGDRTKEGILYCETCDKQIGVVCNYKFDFVHFDKSQICLEKLRQIMPAVKEHEYRKIILPYNSDKIQYKGEWREYENKYQLSDSDNNDSITFENAFSGVELAFVQHDWSGRVKIYIDDDEDTVDLYRRPAEVKAGVAFKKYGLEYRKHKLYIEKFKMPNPNSKANQVFLKSILYETNEPLSKYDRRTGNDGAPFHENIMNEISLLPSEALILDLGGQTKSQR